MSSYYAVPMSTDEFLKVAKTVGWEPSIEQSSDSTALLTDGYSWVHLRMDTQIGDEVACFDVYGLNDASELVEATGALHEESEAYRLLMEKYNG